MFRNIFILAMVVIMVFGIAAVCFQFGKYRLTQQHQELKNLLAGKAAINSLNFDVGNQQQICITNSDVCKYFEKAFQTELTNNVMGSIHPLVIRTKSGENIEVDFCLGPQDNFGLLWWTGTFDDGQTKNCFFPKPIPKEVQDLTKLLCVTNYLVNH